MADEHIKKLNDFDIDSLPDLDTAVLGALELFQKEELPEIKLAGIYNRPLVVGSGNAEAAARIIFQDFYAVFASESTYEEKLKNMPEIDGVVVLSASGGKHAPEILRTAKKYGKHSTLLTNTSGSPAGRELDRAHQYDEYIFPKNREPYTYNVSTYMGMILGHTKENPADIGRFVSQNTSKLAFPDFSGYDAYYLIVPPALSGIARMFQIKFIELFGRKIARDIETTEFVKHATTVVPSKELFISFGEKNDLWGEEENRFFVPLPENAGYGAMMAVGYYVIGQIQKQKPPYFKQNIGNYAALASKIFGQEIKPIVE